MYTHHYAQFVEIIVCGAMGINYTICHFIFQLGYYILARLHVYPFQHKKEHGFRMYKNINIGVFGRVEEYLENGLIYHA